MVIGAGKEASLVPINYTSVSGETRRWPSSTYDQRSGTVRIEQVALQILQSKPRGDVKDHRQHPQRNMENKQPEQWLQTGFTGPTKFMQPSRCFSTRLLLLWETAITGERVGRRRKCLSPTHLVQCLVDHNLSTWRLSKQLLRTL